MQDTKDIFAHFFLQPARHIEMSFHVGKVGHLSTMAQDERSVQWDSSREEHVSMREIPIPTTHFLLLTIGESWNNKIFSYPCFLTTWISTLISTKVYFRFQVMRKKIVKRNKKTENHTKVSHKPSGGVWTHNPGFYKSYTLNLGDALALRRVQSFGEGKENHHDPKPS